MVEQIPLKDTVVGSNPTGRTTLIKYHYSGILFSVDLQQRGKVNKVVLIALVIVLAPFTRCSGIGGQTHLPDYESWTICFGDNTKICIDNNPYLAMNVVTEYSYVGNKALLIWWRYKRSADIFTFYGSIKSYRIEKADYNFYKRKSNGWELVETRSFTRDKYPKNEEIPLFEPESPFGKEYVALKPESTIPTIIFTE